MTAFDYARAQATAARLLAKFGQTGTLTVPGSSSGDAWNPTIGAATTETVTFAVLSFENRDIDGTKIKMGDKKVYLSASGLAAVPTTDCTLTIGSAVHSIEGVEPLSPAGVVVFYQLQCRA